MIGLLVVLLPVGTSLNHQNADAISDYDKGDKKQVSVSSLKCNNINVNVNGLELSVLPPFLDDGEVSATAANGETNTNTFANNGGNDDGSTINEFGFICINNNNNTVNGGEEPEPSEPTTATLKVIKQINCEDQIEGDCEDLLELINENDFIIQVKSNNPDSPSQFPGSSNGTDITVSPGEYIVSEDRSESFFEGLQTFSANHPDRFFSDSPPSFTGECNESISQTATGTIGAGESQTCNIINPITIFASTTSS